MMELLQQLSRSLVARCGLLIIYEMALPVASLVITSVICFVILWIAIWHFRRRRLYELASKLRGPLAFPFIGNAHLFLGSSECLINKFEGLANSYPSPFRLWIGPILMVYVCDPEQIEAICLSPKALGKGRLFMDYSRPLLGAGLVSASVPKWRVHRKLIQPTFNPKILDSFVETFATHSTIMTEIMEKYLDGSEFEVFNLVASCTLDMICETAMGVEGGAQTYKNPAFVGAVQNVLASFLERLCHIWYLHPDFIFYRTRLGAEQRRQIGLIHGFTREVIRTRRIELQKRSRQTDSADNEGAAWESTPRKKAFLDHLMTLPSGTASLSDEELCDEVDTMVLTGTEGSAITVSHVMLMLASYPDVQEKAYQEIYGIYRNDDVKESPVRPEDLSRMKYLERVIRETMRLFPSIPFNAREVADDLDIGKHTLPKGSLAIIGILGMQRSERYWPDPLRFDPDRFLPENFAKRHPCAFLTFGAGPRNCIGLNYAMMSMKTLCATVLRRYILKKDDILPVKDIRLKMEIVLKPVDPIKIRIERRTGN